MVDFIREHGSEVINMLFTEFNMEDALKVRGEERYEEGLADGEARGLAEGLAENIRIVRTKLAKGLSAAEIADILETDEESIAEIVSLIRKYPDSDNSSIAGRYLEGKIR